MNITREEMWAKQHLSASDIDYCLWERDKSMLHRMSKLSHNCTFVVDVYSFRVRNARQQYIRVISKQQVLEQAHNGKAWLIIGNMDIAPNQKESNQVDCAVLNLKNGEIFSPSLL